MKVCSRCNVKKELSEFSTDPRYRLGVTGHCKTCKTEVAKMHKDWNRVLAKPSVTTKRCLRCKETKAASEFYRNSTTRDGYQSKCKPCHDAGGLRARMWPESALRGRLRHGYGMTPEDLRAMVDAQRGLCALCEQPFPKPVIDHDHASGAVRGLLCYRCNSWLAAIEAPGFVEQARSYLSRAASAQPRFRANTRWVEQKRRHKDEARQRNTA